MNNVFILSNSPGEISGWVKPVVEEVVRRGTDARITLVAVPCPYASGMELCYGGEIEGVDNAVTFKNLWRSVLPCYEKNLVLQLGGDPMWGALLSVRFRCAWMIYTSRPKFRLMVTHYFLPDAKAAERFAKAGVSRDKYTTAGNLILESVPAYMDKAEARRQMGLAEGERAITFMPGSRPFEYKEGFPFFCETAEQILSKHSACCVFMPVAPTVDESVLREGLAEAGVNWRGGDVVKEIDRIGPGRISLVRGDNCAALAASDLAVAFPGTNNLQIAALGVPLVVVAPLNKAEEIPLDGLLGLLPSGKLKRKIVLAMNRREKYVTLPNRLAGAPVVEEHREFLVPSMVAEIVERLIMSPKKLEEIKNNYSLIPLERGAASKIAAGVDKFFRSAK